MLEIAPDLFYDDASHTYEYFGSPIPSVTTVLSHKDPIPEFVLARRSFQTALELGRLVHDCTECDDLGKPRPAEYLTGAYASAELWQKWKMDRDVLVMEVEIPAVNAEFWFAGRVDRIVKIKGKTYIIDIKSGALATKGRYQLAAYWMALEEMGWKIDGAGLVSLKGSDWKESFIKQKHRDKWLEIISDYNKAA